MNKLGVSDAEKEQLGREFLEAEADAEGTIVFQMSGPKSKNTPARFVKSEHYAMLEGGYPYAILVRLAEIGRISCSQESKSAVTRSGNISTTYQFTLYTIGFYRKEGRRKIRYTAQTTAPRSMPPTACSAIFSPDTAARIPSSRPEIIKTAGTTLMIDRFFTLLQYSPIHLFSASSHFSYIFDFLSSGMRKHFIL